MIPLVVQRSGARLLAVENLGAAPLPQDVYEREYHLAPKVLIENCAVRGSVRSDHLKGLGHG